MLRIAYFVGGISISTLCMLMLQPEQGDPFGMAYSARVADSAGYSEQIDKGAQRADDGLFYVDGHANGTTVKFLVDTGASYVVLSHRDAKTLSVTSLNTPGDAHLLTAAGLARVDWVKIAEIRLNGHVLKEIRAAVPHADVGISLLGQNALAQFKAIHIRDDRLDLIS